MLAELIETFLVLTQEKFVGICTMLQNHIIQLARTILPRGHIWQQICISISAQDPEHTELVTRTWRCLTDSLRHVNGRVSVDSVQSEVAFICQIYGGTDPLRGERALRTLLAEYHQTTHEPDDAALYIVERLAESLYSQDRYAETEALIEDTLLRAREIRCLSAVHEAGFLETLAQAQHKLFKDDLAEENMRKVIALCVDDISWDDHGVIRTYSTLKHWLHCWGREEEALELGYLRDRMIGLDHLDTDFSLA